MADATPKTEGRKGARKHTGLGRGLGALIPQAGEQKPPTPPAPPARPLDVFFPEGPAASGRGGSAKDLLQPKRATASSKIGPVPNGTVTTTGSEAPARTPRRTAPSASPVGRAGSPPSHRPAITTRVTGTPRASAEAPRRGSRPSGRRSTATRPRSERSSADPRHL